MKRTERGGLVEVDAEVRVGVKRRLRDLQESCCVKGRKGPESVVEAVDLAVELVDDAVVTSPGAVDEADPRTNGLTGQSGSTRAEFIIVTSK